MAKSFQATPHLDTCASDDSGYITTPSSSSNDFTGNSHEKKPAVDFSTPFPNQKLIKKRGKLLLNKYTKAIDAHNLTESVVFDTQTSQSDCTPHTSFSSSSIVCGIDELHVDSEGEELDESVIKENTQNSETVFCHFLHTAPQRTKSKSQFPQDNLVKRLRRERDLNLVCKSTEVYTALVQSSVNNEASLKCNKNPSSFIGFPYIDFLVQLGEHGNFQVILSMLFSHLEPEDLVNITLVSQAWYRICTSDWKANFRRLKYVDHIRHSKENRLFDSKYETNFTFPRKSVLQDIHNINRSSSQLPHSPPSSPSKVRFKMFVKAGSTLENGGRLVPCIRCNRPSHISAYSNNAQCSHSSCQYSFCVLCRCSHDADSCSAVLPSRQQTCCIGSKKSKRNLRRL